MLTLIALLVGGFIGGMLRYTVGSIIPSPGNFPLAVLIINLSGSLVLGALSGWIMARSVKPWLSTGMGAGLIGSFTTFSSFCSGVALLSKSHGLLALVYMLLSVVGGPMLAYVGDWLIFGFSRRTVEVGDEVPTSI